jgi:ABC-type multidrug transport system ATPase subunit
MINISNISKSYQNTQALKNIDLDINKGEIFGLIGPDGAGKSTLFRLLTTLLLPDEGSIQLMELDAVKDFKEVRKRIGYMPGNFSLYQDLTVKENLEFFAKVFNSSIEENFDMIKDIYNLLEPFKDRKAGDLSGGMKQKLALSCALIHKPEILLLDEPTFGVDPVSRKEFWDNLKKLKEVDGLTTLVSTPYMDEAALCDRIALINKGQILDTDTPENISSKYPYDLYSLSTSNNYKILKQIRSIAEIKHSYMFGASIHISVEKGSSISSWIKNIEELQIDYNIKMQDPNVEDVFMQLMEKDENG